MSAASNQLREQADDYLRKHRIMELFEDLCTAICFRKPENINEFLIEQLKLKKQQGFKTGLFAPEELRNIYTLFDLKGDGKLSKDQCKEALKTLAGSEFQFSNVDLAAIPESVNQANFIKLWFIIFYLLFALVIKFQD